MQQRLANDRHLLFITLHLLPQSFYACHDCKIIQHWLVAIGLYTQIDLFLGYYVFYKIEDTSIFDEQYTCNCVRHLVGYDHPFSHVLAIARMAGLSFVALLTVFLASTANALLNSTVPWPVYIKYTTITGYFLQDDPSTNATTFNYVLFNVGPYS